MDNIEHPLISVIVPVYKAEKYLNQCIESVVNQTYQNLEIILVDDGSPDRCPEMCDNWAQRDDRIKVIHKKNRGGASARNTGIEIATGSYIAFVDADDILSIYMYDILANVALITNCDIVECGYTTENEMLQNHISCDSLHFDLLSAEQALEQNISGKIQYQVIWNKLYRTNCIGNTRFVEGKFIDDVFFIFRVYGKASHVAVIVPALYYYRQHENSAMHEEYSAKWLQAIEAYCERYSYVEENYPALETKARIAIVNGCLYHGQMCLNYLYGKEKKDALDYLIEEMRKYPIKYAEYRDMKFTHRAWLTMARINLLMTCRIRNALNIGR